MAPFPASVPGAHPFLISFRKHSLGGLRCALLCFSSAVCVPGLGNSVGYGPAAFSVSSFQGGEWDLVDTSSELLSLA